MKKLVAVFVLIVIALTVLVGSGYVKYIPDIILTKKDGNWLDTRVYATMGDVLTALSVDTDPCTVVVVREETYDNDGTWPTHAEIVFRGKGRITQTAGTLSMWASRINAPERVVFSSTGAGSYDFADGVVLHSSWFDDFDDAVAITSNDTGTLQVDGWETLTGSASLGTEMVLRFDNEGDFLYLNSGAVLSNVAWVEAGRFQIFRGAGRVDFTDGSELRTSWFERFDEAIRYVDDSEISLVIDKAETLVANSTVPYGVSLVSTAGAVLTTTANLTVNGSLTAGLYQVFDDSTGGVVTLSQLARPQWFGAKVNDGTDDTSAIESANAAGGVLFAGGTYNVIDCDLTVPPTFEGTVVFSPLATSSYALKFSGDNWNGPSVVGGFMVDIDLTSACTGVIVDGRNWVFPKIRIDGNDIKNASSYNHKGISLQDGTTTPLTHNHFVDLYIDGVQHGFYVSIPTTTGNEWVSTNRIGKAYIADCEYGFSIVDTDGAYGALQNSWNRMYIENCDYGLNFDSSSLANIETVDNNSYYDVTFDNITGSNWFKITGNSASNVCRPNITVFLYSYVDIFSGGTTYFDMTHGENHKIRQVQSWGIDSGYTFATDGSGGWTNGYQLKNLSTGATLAYWGYYGGSADALSYMFAGPAWNDWDLRLDDYGVWSNSGFNQTRKVVTYSPAMTINCQEGSVFYVDVTDAVAMSIANPTNPVTGREITFDIYNSHVAPMGTITWGALYELAGSFTNPATTKHRLIKFYYDGAKWREVSRSAADQDH